MIGTGEVWESPRLASPRPPLPLVMNNFLVGGPSLPFEKVKVACCMFNILIFCMYVHTNSYIVNDDFQYFSDMFVSYI